MPIRLVEYALNLMMRNACASKAFRFGKNSFVHHTCSIGDLRHISIGEGVNIAKDCIINCNAGNGTGKPGAPKIEIGDGATISERAVLFAEKKISLGKNVVVSHNAYIADHSHRYSDISKPIKCQGSDKIKEVHVGENTWIGINACIMPGCSIGKNCVVGANSVVTHSFPDYCVISGIPARIIKKYDLQKKCWAMQR